ncbi:MAG: hypothetical protein AVDCRST_MAG65-1785, partial [uncultured Solirubrobacteraceae bacterium]
GRDSAPGRRPRDPGATARTAGGRQGGDSRRAARRARRRARRRRAAGHPRPGAADLRL